MNQILKRVHDVDPNDSEAVKEALSPFFQNLSKHQETDCSTWLRALENIIDRFPKFCTSQRSSIETYLTHFLKSDNYYDVIEAAKCAHVLQQVRPSQDKAATAKACWREQVNILCNAAHSLIEALFTNSVNIFKNSAGSQNDTAVLANRPLTEALQQITKVKKIQHKKSILITRLRNVLVFLQAMLVEIYPVAKPIRPQIILEVIVRALSASSGKNEGVDVSTVKIQALRTMDALVECLGPNLIPFSALIFRFVMQTLRWTSDKPSKESIKVRCKAYASLGEWLRVLHVYRAGGGTGGGGAGAGAGGAWEEELAAHVIGDVTPPQQQMQLTMSKQPTKNLSKKAKRRLANTMLQESSIAAHIPGEKNKITIPEEVSDEVAIAALECAEVFITACGIFLKPTTHKLLVERIVGLCYSADACSGARALQLLHVLEALRCSAPRAAPAHAHHCLQLYSTLINSRRREIATFCSQALLNIRLHLHCSPPSLNFALPALPEKRTQDNRKRVSERNRAVLESLLGAERMPSEDQEDDVISIPDEPSSKKICLQQNATDKISVSSDSASSVEISDESTAEDGLIQVVEVVIEEVKDNYVNNEVDIVPMIEENTDSESVDTNPGPNTLVEIEATLDQRSNIKLTIEQTIRDSEIVIEQFNAIENNIAQPNDTPRVRDIFEARTQMPLNASNDTFDDEDRPLSMEVAYDYPNTGQGKVTVLEKMDDENLPSTNDTDDIQITCGQDVKISQSDADKNTDSLEQDVDKNNDIVDESVPKENGIDKSPERVVANGDVGIETCNVSVKIVSKDGITVEDMLADFVDEVNEETQSIVA